MSGSVSFDPVASRYDATRSYPLEVAQRIAEGLVRMGGLKVGGSLLEIGIGTGRIALPLLALGYHIVGVDISSAMVARLREKYDTMRAEQPERPWGTLRVQMADMTALPFADAIFDAAVGVHVLHLVPEWRRALDEVLRVIRPGGAFLLGQDQRLAEDLPWRVQSEWMEIVRSLGFMVGHVGAGYTAVKAELQHRGLHLHEERLAAWETEITPRAALAYIAGRTWSLTWQVPPDIFEESVRLLTERVTRQYADAMDTPQQIPEAFMVTSVRRS